MSADAIFLGVLVLGIVGAVVYVQYTGRGFAERIQRELQRDGFVISHARQRHRGPVTWVWGRYAQPVPFHLHFSNRDIVAVVAGRLGMASIPLGVPEFDARFFLRSNQPDWAREFMTPQLCARLLAFESVEFVTSSVGSLLTPDYWPGERDRDRRDVWMLRTDGRIEGADAQRYVQLARDLSGSLAAFCARTSHVAEDCRSPALEGR